jgi:hypothetical protein
MLHGRFRSALSQTKPTLCERGDDFRKGIDCHVSDQALLRMGDSTLGYIG